MNKSTVNATACAKICFKPDDHGLDTSQAPINSVGEALRILGRYEDFALRNRAQDGERSYRYQAQFSRIKMIYYFSLTKEGRISVMMPEMD